ncbi:MAG: YHYH protein, partial [Chloroflexota bacterium]
EGSGDLDQCNGLTLADGSYAYFATDTFPYFMGCYYGVANLPRTPGR